MKNEEGIRDVVRQRYGKLAAEGGSCCGSGEAQRQTERCCHGGHAPEDLVSLDAATVSSGLGCGNPVSLAGLIPGEVVPDLGSGGGLDVFLAARRVGPSGRVIGVDMTPEMLARARANAERLGLTNVEFRRGLIEVLPVEDASVDVILSNCVINLAPDKGVVFTEIATADGRR